MPSLSPGISAGSCETSCLWAPSSRTRKPEACRLRGPMSRAHVARAPIPQAASTSTLATIRLPARCLVAGCRRCRQMILVFGCLRCVLSIHRLCTFSSRRSLHAWQRKDGISPAGLVPSPGHFRGRRGAQTGQPRNSASLRMRFR